MVPVSCCRHPSRSGEEWDVTSPAASGRQPGGASSALGAMDEAIR